jgi:hypothetical protein
VQSVRGEGLSGDGGGFERCQADDLGTELTDAMPLTVSGTNPSSFEFEANPGDVSASYRIPDQLPHGRGVPHPADEAPNVRNLANQVGALPIGAEAAIGLELPLSACWFYIAPGATHGVEHANFTLAEAAALFGEAPTNGLAAVDAELLGESPGEVEVATALHRPVLDDFGSDLAIPGGDHEVDPARKHGMGDSHRAGVERGSAGGLVRVGAG